MNETSLENLGENVRVQGGQAHGKMTDLVFDTTTGEFRTVTPNEPLRSQDMDVTEMTREGFALSI